MNMNEATDVNKFVKHFDIILGNQYSFVKIFSDKIIDLSILHPFWNSNATDWYMGYLGKEVKQLSKSSSNMHTHTD
jgi:predicted methyltransferase